MFKLIRPILNISVIKQARNYTTPVIKTIKYKTKDETYVAKGKVSFSLGPSIFWLFSSDRGFSPGCYDK